MALKAKDLEDPDINWAQTG